MQQNYNPLELTETTVLRWAYCLAAKGHIDDAATLIGDVWEGRRDLKQSRGEALFDVFLEAFWYGQTRPGELVELVDENELSREEFALFMLPLTKELLERGRVDEMLSICESFSHDPSIPADSRYSFRCNTALGFLSLGQLEKAERLLPDVEEVKGLESNEPAWQVLVVQAGIWGHRGAYAKALELIKESRKYEEGLLASQVYGARVEEVEYLFRAGRRNEAWELLIELDTIIDESSPVSLIRLLLIAGFLFLQEREFAEAKSCLEKGLSMALEEGAEVFVPQFYLNLEWAAQVLEDDKLLQECHSFFEENAWTFPLAYSLFQINQARELIDAGRQKEAEAILEETLELLLDTGQIANAADVLDDLSRIQEEDSQARHYSRQALDLLLALLTAVDDSGQRLNIHSRLRYVAARLASLQIDAGLESAALDTVHEAKSGEFLYLVANSKDGEIEPDLKEALTTSVAGEDRVLSVDEDPQSSLHTPSSMTPSVSQAQRQVEFADIKALHRHRPSLSVDAAAICAQLRPGEVAMEYFLPDYHGDELSIFVLDSDGMEVVRRPWSSEQMEKAGELSELIRHGPSASPGEARRRQRRLIELLRNIYEVLLAPVEATIDIAQHLLLAPGAMLASIPFSALVSSDGEFLADRVSLGFLASTAQIPTLPDKANQLRSSVVLRGEDDGDIHLERSDREIESIRELLAEEGVPVLSAKKLWQADLIHYSGHAYFDEESAMDARLATAEDTLRAADFMGQSFEATPLVFLAGCETGRFESMGDEFVGFIRSLFTAGASHIVASSWKADDEGTAWLVEEFYRQLLSDRVSPVVALARASKAMRRHPECPQWRHPYYWANFRCWGPIG